MDNSEKLKALDAAISKIEKDFGKGAIMKLGDKSKNMDVETVPTGSLSLDLALGLGGLPKGRVVEISHSGSAVCRAAELSRSTDRNLPVKPQ